LVTKLPASRKRPVRLAQDKRKDSKREERVMDMNDWAGADAGKYTYEEMTRKLDRLRARWR
jgi:Arc/MetJ-type ribon-helix-helix transcriptional regulator